MSPKSMAIRLLAGGFFQSAWNERGGGLRWVLGERQQQGWGVGSGTGVGVVVRVELP